MADFLHRFAEGFSALNKDNLPRLGELYSVDIHFTDPLHDVHGLAELQRYFAQLYANVEQLQFEFHGFDDVINKDDGGEGYLRWVMTYRHPRLHKGQPIAVQGCSHLQWHDDRVTRHHDYFDAGAMLYEHLPLMGPAVAWLKRRMA
jgi:hypothetical protein